MSDKTCIITFREDATPAQIQAFYRTLEDQGTTIHKKKHDSDILKFATATLSQDLVASVQGNDIVESIEEDSVVTTQ